MTFFVDPVVLQGLPEQLDRLGEDASKGRAYVENFIALEYGPGVLNDIKNNHEHVVKEVTEWLKDLKDLTASNTSAAIDKVIIYHKNTDTENENL